MRVITLTQAFPTRIFAPKEPPWPGWVGEQPVKVNGKSFRYGLASLDRKSGPGCRKSKQYVDEARLRSPPQPPTVALP